MDNILIQNLINARNALFAATNCGLVFNPDNIVPRFDFMLDHYWCDLEDELIFAPDLDHFTDKCYSRREYNSQVDRESAVYIGEELSIVSCENDTCPGFFYVFLTVNRGKREVAKYLISDGYSPPG